jgi:predicted permease
MDTFAQDLRYGLRRLIKSPGFSAVIVLTLALGIGANTAIFSVVNAILLRPLPYAQPHRLVTIEHFYPSLNDLEAPVSAAGFRDYRDKTKSFESVAVQTGWSANLTGVGDPERLQGSRVSGDYFRVYGVPAALGRTLRRDEDAVGNNKVVVLSDVLWRRLYGAQRDVVGKSIQLNGEPYEIVGVMPAGFRNFWARNTELWTPLALREEQFNPDNYTNEFLALSARLKPGVTEQSAATEMRQFAEQLKRDRPTEFGARWSLKVSSLNQKATGKIRPALLVLLGAVGFVLLIACANVANLLLSRAAQRSKEIAVRAALGAKRWRIVRQLLTESLLLALTGGLFGLVLAFWGVHALSQLDTRNVPFAPDLTIDSTVMLFTLATAVITGILFGLVPALQSLRSDVQETLRTEGRGTTTDRSGHLIRRGLVVAEIALALTLLAGAGLLIKSFARLSGVEPGFNASNLLTFQLSLPAAKYMSDTMQIAFFDQALAELKRVPGVVSAGATQVMPFGGNWSTTSFDIEGIEVPQGQPGPWGDFRMVSPDFARTLEIPLLRGRFITESDRKDAPYVAVIDEEFVKRYFPKDNPIGRRITFGAGPDGQTQYVTIVGVVGHTKHEGLDAENRLQLYLPYAQMTQVNQLAVALRTAGDPAGYVSAVRQAVRNVDRDQPISEVRTMDDLLESSLGQRRLSMTLIVLFAGLAVVLASLGIYGVMSQLVNQRQRELGVRMALGAATSDVLGLVLRQGMTLTAGGVVLGFAGAFALTRLMSSQLYSVSATDPFTFVAVALLLTIVAFLATSIPALRAARLDPVTALRQE